MARAPEPGCCWSVQLAADTVLHRAAGPLHRVALLGLSPGVLRARSCWRPTTWTPAGRWPSPGLAAILTGGGHFGLALGWLLTGTETDPGLPAGLAGAGHRPAHVGLPGHRDDQRRPGPAPGPAPAGTGPQRTCMVQKARCEVRNILDNIQSGLITVDTQGRDHPGQPVVLPDPAACRRAELLGATSSWSWPDGMEELADDHPAGGRRRRGRSAGAR